MSFAAKFQRSQCGTIVLYFGMQNRIPCYFYIKLNPIKRDMFYRAVQQQTLTPSEWGEVLLYGAGKTTTKKDAAFMLEEYGFYPEDAAT